MKFSIAIIEDDFNDAEALLKAIKAYGEEVGHQFAATVYPCPDKFLSAYRADVDVVFMDIELPGYDGLHASRLLREKDVDVPLIFVTNMAQYAINGYEVGAFDFIVKPIVYNSFKNKMTRLLKLIESGNSEDKIEIKTKSDIRVVRIANIRYVDSNNHTVTFHTVDGEYASFMSMRSVCDRLPKDEFALCNQSYLVNMRYVTSVAKNDLYLGDEILPISRLKKKEFQQKFAEFIGKRI